MRVILLFPLVICLLVVAFILLLPMFLFAAVGDISKFIVGKIKEVIISIKDVAESMLGE